MTLDIQWVGSPNFRAQSNVPKLFITLHWMVGTLKSTDSLFKRAGTASSTYGVGGGEIHQYVREKDYPWSDGNTYANQHTISIEHEGGWLLPGGSRFKPTQATQETSARLCADIARRHGFGRLVVGVNVFRHSHWVATTCPGTLDVEWIVARANAINDGTAGGDITPIKEEEIMATNWVDTSTYDSRQNAVAGTQCLTTWEGGPSMLYPRTMQAGETAAIMFELYGPHKEVNHAQFEAVKAAFAVPSGGADSGPVLSAVGRVDAKVDALTVQISKYPKPPTAEENGAAARAAIVKEP